MSEIQRLVDDPETPAGVREGLQKTAAATEPYDVEAGLGRLQAVLAAGGVAAASGTAAAATTVSSASKIWLTLTLVGALVGGGAIAYVASQDDGAVGSRVDPAERVAAPEEQSTAAETSQTTESAEPTEAAERIVAPESAEPAESTEPAEPAEPTEATAIGPRARTPRQARPSRAATGSPSDALREETLHLARVRAALEGSPAEALRLAREGQRLFPRGVFAEERQALIVMALHGAGRTDRARRAAAAFIERYPNGPLTERVREIYESP